ncbi:hypothetical protein ES703_112630 [subsurface metagenome]
MAQELAFAAPTTEEMTRVGVVGVGAGFTGAVEGVIVSVAPKLGALELPFTWGTLLGVPAVGAAAALMTKGMLSDAGLGIAAGGLAILGYTMPAMLQEFTLARGKGQLTAEQRAALAAGNVKQLGAGPLGAAARAQQAGARVGLEF